MCRPAHELKRIVGWLASEHDLEQPDDFAALRHRCQDPPATDGGHGHRPLIGDDLTDHRLVKGQCLCELLAELARTDRVFDTAAQPDQGAAGELPRPPPARRKLPALSKRHRLKIGHGCAYLELGHRGPVAPPGCASGLAFGGPLVCGDTKVH